LLLLVRILVHGDLVGSPCRAAERVRVGRRSLIGIRPILAVHRVDRIVHRDVHHRGGAHALERQEMILGCGDRQELSIPGDDDVGGQTPAALEVACAAVRRNDPSDRRGRKHGGFHCGSLGFAGAAN
jgi:hypothetical protein